MATPLQMATTPRDGYANDATWIVCLHLENDRNAQYHFKNVLTPMKLMTQERVQHEVQLWLSNWFTRDAAGYTEVAQKIIDGWLGNIVDWLNWPQIVEMLHNPGGTVMDVHLYTTNIVQVLRENDWENVIEGIEGYSAQAEALKLVLRYLLQGYQNEPSYWQWNHTLQTKLAQRIYDEYLAAVNWQQVYTDLVEE